jgi:hypothetical protein
VFCVLVAFAGPLQRASASTRFAIVTLLVVDLVLVYVTSQSDPGVIPPGTTDDPIIARLDARKAARTAAREAGEGAGREVREQEEDDAVARVDHAGQYYRPSTTRGGDGDDDELELERAGMLLRDEETDRWDWSKCERYCRTCRIWRPPRAGHCSDCGWCVRRFDHHCGAVSNCVGNDNHRWFVSFLCVTSALVLSLTCACVDALRRTGWPARAASWNAATFFLIACAFACSAMSLGAIFALSHVWLCLADVTTKEMLTLEKKMRADARQRSARGDGSSGAAEAAGRIWRAFRSGGWRRLCRETVWGAKFAWKREHESRARPTTGRRVVRSDGRRAAG